MRLRSRRLASAIFCPSGESRGPRYDPGPATVIVAFSQSSPETAVNRRASPPGSRCGSTWRSAFDPSAVVTIVGVPPSADTFEMPVQAAKKIVPSGDHEAPHPTPDTSAIVAGGPPAAGTFFSVLPAQNP